MAYSRTWSLTLTHVLVWTFALSWALDFKAEAGASGHGGTLGQAVFLGLSVFAGGAVMALNARFLTRRPGVWLLAMWWGFLIFVTVVSLVQGVEIGRFARIVIPYLLIGLGLGVAQAAAGRGLSAHQIVLPWVVAGTINIVWRIGYGFAVKGATLETARMEVFSPAMNPLFAYLAAAWLLRPRFPWSTLVVAAAALCGMLLTVTRALLFPMAVAGGLGAVCLLLSLKWRALPPRVIPRKLGVLAAGLGAALVAMVAVPLAAPTLAERWEQRLFHHASDRQLSADPSWLSRAAEARGMLSILQNEPLDFLWGRGIGASYHWDPSYWPELWAVYPADTDFSADIWYNSHSLWTYTIFSGGAVGLACHLALLVGAAGIGVVAVRAAGRAGRVDDQSWLGFLPLLVVACLVSESATSNQLAERLSGVILGMTAGATQALYGRRRGAGIPNGTAHHPWPPARLASTPPSPPLHAP